MKKILSLFAFSIFALVFLMSAVSAAVSFVPDFINQEILHGQTSTTINFQVNNNGTLPVLVTFSETFSPVGVSWVLPSQTIINNGSSVSFSATLSGISLDFIGSIISNIKVENTTPLLDDLPVTINVTAPSEVLECNDVENPGDLEVRSIDFTNNGLSNSKFGSDDEWFPFEEIEVEIDIKNKGDYDVDDIEVSWGLYDVNEGEWVIDLDEEDDFNIKEGDTETLTVSFKIDDDDLDADLDELNDDTDNYRLYVVAEGTIDDSKAGSLDGDETCAFDYESASMMIENDFVILDDIEVPEVVQCDANVQITADVWNIGDDDQDDVYVLVKSNELGINNKKIEIGDIDKFDNAPFNFDFQVPSDAEEKTYAIRFTVYDEDNDIYENDDDDESVFSVFLEVEGNCVADSEVLISASLVSEAKAGKEMVMSVLLTNTADAARSFTMEAYGYDAWAEISELPGLLTLNADSVGEVLFKFDIKKGISGEQTFLIKVYSDNELIKTQPVSVNIESAKPLFGITGLVTTDNAYLWGIGLLNIILIVIIILVAVRIARRK